MGANDDDRPYDLIIVLYFASALINAIWAFVHTSPAYEEYLMRSLVIVRYATVPFYLGFFMFGVLASIVLAFFTGPFGALFFMLVDYLILLAPSSAWSCWGRTPEGGFVPRPMRRWGRAGFGGHVGDAGMRTAACAIDSARLSSLGSRQSSSSLAKASAALRACDQAR